MARPGRSRWFRLAIAFALAFVIVLALIFAYAIQGAAPQAGPPLPGPTPAPAPPPSSSSALLLGLGALCFTGIGTISSVILGWRSERRQAAESRLRVAQLEMQLAQAKADAEKTG